MVLFLIFISDYPQCSWLDMFLSLSLKAKNQPPLFYLFNAALPTKHRLFSTIFIWYDLWPFPPWPPLCLLVTYGYFCFWAYFVCWWDHLMIIFQDFSRLPILSFEMNAWRYCSPIYYKIGVVIKYLLFLSKPYKS